MGWPEAFFIIFDTKYFNDKSYISGNGKVFFHFVKHDTIGGVVSQHMTRFLLYRWNTISIDEWCTIFPIFLFEGFDYMGSRLENINGERYMLYEHY